MIKDQQINFLSREENLIDILKTISTIANVQTIGELLASIFIDDMQPNISPQFQYFINTTIIALDKNASAQLGAELGDKPMFRR